MARALKTVPRIISNQPLIVSVQGLTQALTTVGTPPIQRALTLATRVKRGEPVIAHRRMPTPLRTRQAFSRPVNAPRVPFVSERISIIVAPSPQMTGITATGPAPAIIALEAISTSWTNQTSQEARFGTTRPWIVPLIKGMYEMAIVNPERTVNICLTPHLHRKRREQDPHCGLLRFSRRDQRVQGCCQLAR